MKTTRIALLALALAGAGLFAGTETRPAAAIVSAGLHIGPSGHARVDLGFFYDDLAPYGSWVERPSYGWVWSPRITHANWRPYQYGHWAWTDYGWTWISDEAFGWATYHYGRWYDDPSYGWEWVPGNEWAPSYVSWQEGDNYIGWAPLPPSVSIRTGFLNVSLSPVDYLFVPEGRFLDARVYDYAVPRGDCERIYRQTRNWTNYRYEGNRVFAAGVPVDRVQRVIGRNVPRYQVSDLGWNQRHQARFSGNRVAMFRPQVQRGGRVDPPSARPLARNSVVGAAQLRQSRQQPGQNVAGQGRFNRQQQQQQALSGRQAQNQGRWQQQQVQRQERQAQNQGRAQQQVQRQERQAQNQGRWQQQQVQRQERQAQNQGRSQQQVLRQERQAQNQGRWQQQQVQRQERQAQNQGRWQQQQAQRQERQMARQQQARPQQQQQRVHQNRGGGRPQGNDRGNRHGRNDNG